MEARLGARIGREHLAHQPFVSRTKVVGQTAGLMVGGVTILIVRIGETMFPNKSLDITHLKMKLNSRCEYVSNGD